LYGPDQFQRISKALADPQRLAILEPIVTNSEVACAALCEQFPVSQATISHHVKELSNAGLIRVRRQAKLVYCRLETKVWNDRDGRKALLGGCNSAILLVP
jgi:ArsR family transcriptional regulator